MSQRRIKTGKRAKPNGIDSDPSFKSTPSIDPTLANPPKATLPTPQNPTAPPPLELELTAMESEYFAQIKEVSGRLSQQLQNVNQQASGALVLILNQRKVDIRLNWELSDDNKKLIRSEVSPSAPFVPLTPVGAPTPMPAKKSAARSSRMPVPAAAPAVPVA